MPASQGRGARGTPYTGICSRAGCDRDHRRRRIACALACLAIYLFSFLLGANYDYRLIYLVGTLAPALAAYDADARRAWLTWPAVVVVFLWTSRVGAQLHLAGEAFDWLIFAGGAAWVMLTLQARLLPDRRMTAHGTAIAGVLR